MASDKHAHARKPTSHRPKHDHSVLVLRGGGALGAYQAGVYQGMAQQGFAPDWVTGVSIGAINASLIAGNLPMRVGTMTAALRQDQLAQALKRSILAYRLLIIDGHQPLATRPRVRSEQRFYSLGYAH